MRKLQYIVSLAAIMLAASASAVLIASDSFSTVSPFVSGQYSNGCNLAAGPNIRVVVGTTGFVTNKGWSGNTALLATRNTVSLTNLASVAGSTTNGGLNYRPGAWTVAITTNAGVVTTNISLTLRGAYRQLADTNLTGSTFFMSGLIKMGVVTNINNNETVTMGMSTAIAANWASIESGVHF